MPGLTQLIKQMERQETNFHNPSINEALFKGVKLQPAQVTVSEAVGRAFKKDERCFQDVSSLSPHYLAMASDYDEQIRNMTPEQRQEIANLRDIGVWNRHFKNQDGEVVPTDLVDAARESIKKDLENRSSETSHPGRNHDSDSESSTGNRPEKLNHTPVTQLSDKEVSDIVDANPQGWFTRSYQTRDGVSISSDRWEAARQEQTRRGHLSETSNRPEGKQLSSASEPQPRHIENAKRDIRKTVDETFHNTEYPDTGECREVTKDLEKALKKTGKYQSVKITKGPGFNRGETEPMSFIIATRKDGTEVLVVPGRSSPTKNMFIGTKEEFRKELKTVLSPDELESRIERDYGTDFGGEEKTKEREIQEQSSKDLNTPEQLHDRMEAEWRRHRQTVEKAPEDLKNWIKPPSTNPNDYRR